MKAENVAYIALVALAAYVIYVNVTGKKDKKVDYSADPKFQSPLAE